MEKTMTTEDKIKRAEEIYNRRRESQNGTPMAKVNINEKKDIKLFKKMFIQIIACLTIYSGFYLVKNNNYIFSEDFLNKSKEVLSYDINFQELYSKTVEHLKNNGILTQEKENNTENEQNIQETENNQEPVEENGIGGAEENKEETNELSQMEQDALNIKNSISFINPIEGTITSAFGLRNPTTSSVPKFHTGLDIANASGTPIYSATDGDVILASSEGDYRKSFKNTNW